jgi:hypothetical protein
MYYYNEYAAWTEENRKKVAQACSALGVTVSPSELAFRTPADNWRMLHDDLLSSEFAGKTVLVDISTMPRNTIWLSLFFLQSNSCRIHYVYNRPETYNQEWLSRDPQRPRLVFKLSGEMALGRRTALVILTGFDVERTRQLIRFYEPRTVLLGYQTGEQYGNQAKNVAQHREGLREEYKELGIQEFFVNAYEYGHGIEEVRKQVQRYREEYNIIMSSLGPKPSAIALYRVQREFRECGLSYAPSGDFNRDYSYGIGKSIGGTIEAQSDRATHAAKNGHNH